VADGRRTWFAPARAAQPWFPYEWLVVAVVVIVGGVIVAVWSRNTWFYTDVWDFLALRRLGDVESIVRPHFGHWQVPAAIQTRILYAVAGMDFWPVHYLPRAFGWAGVSVFSWWVMRRRGAHPLAALGAVAVMTVLATSFYLHAAHIGALIAATCVVGAGLLIESRPSPTYRDRWWLFAILFLAVMSAGLGVSALPGVTLALLVLRRLRDWYLPVVAVAVIYATWFITFDVASADAAEAVRTVAEVPLAAVENIKNILINVSGLPEALGWPLLVAAFAGVAWLAWRRKLTVLAVVTLATALVYVGLISRTRSNLARGAVATNVTLLLAPVFVPYVSRLRRGAAVVVGAVFAALVVSHGIRLEDGIAERIAVINEGRPTIESMATLIGRGDRYLPPLRLTDLSGSSQLDLRGMAHLVDEGWRPGPPRAESAATVRLRVSFYGATGPRSGSIEPLRGRLRRDGCIIAVDGQPIVLDVSGTAGVKIRAAPRTDLAVRWRSGDDQGRATLVRVRRRDRDLFLYGPPEGATITLDPVTPVRKMLLCELDGYLAP
jgi:hypothetical protein